MHTISISMLRGGSWVTYDKTMAHFGSLFKFVLTWVKRVVKPISSLTDGLRLDPNWFSLETVSNNMNSFIFLIRTFVCSLIRFEVHIKFKERIV